MMQIKFRAWDTTLKCYEPVGSIEFLNGGIKVEGTGVHIGNGWATKENGFAHDCDVILEQFTGLYDKDGNEIYEGDIVEKIYIEDSYVDDTINEIVIGIGVIEYNIDCMSFIIDQISGSKWIFDYIEGYNGILNDIRIIGNIHENPEYIIRRNK